MAHTSASAHSGKAIAILRVEPYEHRELAVVCSAIGEDGRLDPVYAADGDNTSPPLQWTAVLEAQSYVLVVQDPDAPQVDPVIHWVVWDIPGTVSALEANLGTGAHPPALPGAVQGLNSHGGTGWTGMAPPVGEGPHRYHFQVFAVNRALHLRPDTPLEILVEALKGSTLAKGEVVGLYERPDPLD